MKSGKYIKDRLYSMCIFVAMLIISVLMMAAFKVSVQLIIAEICIMIICYIAVVLADYYHRKKFYDELEANIAALEEKYLITETLVRPAFYEGQIFYDSVSDIDRSMTENVKRYRQGMEQFKEYVEMWIHEIKLPIASLCCGSSERFESSVNSYDSQTLIFMSVDQTLFESSVNSYDSQTRILY